jgi:aminopeptidase N
MVPADLAGERPEAADNLVSHEMTQQWFGHLVTCKDWSHLWLNEGFATYYAHLYDAHKNGRDAMLYGLYQDARGFLDVPNDTNAIVRRNFDSPDEQFGFHAYPKGSWVLQMLRSQLGEELYRRCIKTYLERHQYGNVTTEDLNAVIEELSGRSYDQFFDQWVYKAGYPELRVRSFYQAPTRKLTLEVTQTQSAEAMTPLVFRLPVEIEIGTDAGEKTESIEITRRTQRFTFQLDGKPLMIRFDKGARILKKVDFPQPASMLKYQLTHSSDAIGRTEAAEALARLITGAPWVEPPDRPNLIAARP